MITAKFDSSAIESIRYVRANRNLTVTFTSGGSYDYPDVPEEKILDWLKAESAGKYFHKEIKQYSIK